MATTAADTVFVDTNVLVYANTATAPLHAEAQAVLRSFAAPGAELWVSRQILREHLATLSRPLEGMRSRGDNRRIPRPRAARRRRPG